MLDQLTDGRPRNEHALIDNERQATEPCLPQQVGSRYTLFDAPT